MSISEPELSASEVRLLQYLAREVGADIWEYPDAMVGRSLDRHGLAEIVPAMKRAENGAARQPYYGIKITREGRDWLPRRGIVRRSLEGVESW